MVYNNFQQIIEKVKNNKSVKKVALVAAHDEHSLEAIHKAEINGIIESVLIGDKLKIEQIIKNEGLTGWEPIIIDEVDDDKAAVRAVKMARNNEVDALMKGKIETSGILKAVVNKEYGLSTGRVMSHFVIQEVPAYHKLLVTSDGGMMMYPNLQEKKAILENAVSIMNRLGYENPKVGVLAAVEKVNPKMPETIDADKLKEMNKTGEIKNCIVEGPISLDLALDKSIAAVKGYESEVSGDADILIVPNITAGNILGKALICGGKAKMAGFIVGAKVPIVLTSRGSSFEEKYMSLVLAAALDNEN